MPCTNIAVILAAGNGSRIRDIAGALPKPLVSFNGKPLLEHVLIAGQNAGIERFVITVGYQGHAIRSWVANRRFEGLQIDCVENPDYHKANGVSLLVARQVINEPFLLLMSDHIFESETAAALLSQHLQKDEVILAVDRKLDSIFDIDDATKVRSIANYIVDIGKEVSGYDSVDTGMFLCSPAIFSALEQVKLNDNCSLSDGMRLLAADRKLRAFDIGDAVWQDVDTPEMLTYGSNVLFRPFDTSGMSAEVVGA